MQRLSGQLIAGERVVFRKINAVLEEPIPGRSRTGYFEVQEGSAPFLSTTRTYRITLDDGQSEEIHVTGTWPGAPAGVAAFTFRVCREGAVSGARHVRHDVARHRDERDLPRG